MWMNHILLESGGDLLFRAVSSQVPSALKGLTSVFGMGTGGTPSPLPPETVAFLGAEVGSFCFPLHSLIRSCPRYPILPPGVFLSPEASASVLRAAHPSGLHLSMHQV